MKIDIYFTKSVSADLSTSSQLSSPVITLSLINRMGLDGKSAYEVALDNGFEGSEEEWLESLTKLSPEADTIAHQAAADAAEAIEKAESALSSAQSAVTASNAAASQAQNAAESSSDAAQSAQEAADKADAATNSAAQANQKAESALTIAQSAAEDATTAVVTAQNAEQSATAASTAANNALQSTSAAAVSAANAQSAAEQAVENATSAQAIAQEASQNAAGATATAQQALQKSESALTTSQSASQVAEDASTAAQNAVETANTASTTANNALQSTSEAAAAAASALSAAEQASQNATNAQTAAQEAAQSAENALAAATAATDAATESQENSAIAVETATQALEATTNLDNEIDQVYNTLLQEIQNIETGGSSEPETPKNTGVSTYGGFYTGVSPLALSGNMGVEILFSTGDNITASQYVFTMGSAESLMVSNGKIVFTYSSTLSVDLCADAKPNSSYHFLLTFASDTKLVEIFLNGALQDSRTFITWSTNITGLRFGKGTTFQGVIHHCRFFSDVPTDSIIAELWNYGKPDSYTLPDSLRTENGGICKAEFLPEGISDGLWTDTSENAYQFQASGTVTPSQVVPQELGTINLSTGLISDIGNVNTSISVPAGYRIDQLVFTSYNESAMTGISISDNGTSSVLLETASLAAGGSFLTNPSATGYTYIHGGNTLSITAAGNTINGCQIDVTAVWLRVR